MPEVCRFRPEYPTETAHRFSEAADHPGWFTCDYCHVPRDDMTCYCASFVAGHYEEHTVGKHWEDSCGGFGSWSGPCGGCPECVDKQVLHNATEEFVEYLRQREEQLRSTIEKDG